MWPIAICFQLLRFSLSYCACLAYCMYFIIAVHFQKLISILSRTCNPNAEAYDSMYFSGIMTENPAQKGDEAVANMAPHVLVGKHPVFWSMLQEDQEQKHKSHPTFCGDVTAVYLYSASSSVGSQSIILLVWT